MAYYQKSFTAEKPAADDDVDMNVGGKLGKSFGKGGHGAGLRR